MKLSSSGRKLYGEKFNSSEKVFRNIALDPTQGNFWVVVEERRPAKKYRLIKYSPSAAKLFTGDAFVQQEPTGMAVDPYTGKVWLGYAEGVVVHKTNGDYKKSLPDFSNIRAFAFTASKAIMGGGKEERSYYLCAINKETGRENWVIKEGHRPVTYLGFVER